MTNWVLLIGALLIAGILWGRSKPSFLWVIAALLTIVAAQSFAEIWPGQFLARMLGGLFGFFASPSNVATVLLLAAVLYAVFDVAVDRKLDKGGAGALFLIPVLALIAGGGPLVSGVSSFFNAIQDGAASVLNSI